MKKIILFVLALLSFGVAQNATTTNGDPFSQMDKIFQMQLKQMEQMQKQMDAMFNEFSKMGFKNTTPMVMSSGGIISSGIEDKKDHYEVVINVGKGDIKADVKAKDNILTIKVEQSNEVKETNSSFGVVKSFSSSSYMQSFTLPKDADSNKIDYSIKDGKMVVKIGKIKE